MAHCSVPTLMNKNKLVISSKSIIKTMTLSLLLASPLLADPAPEKIKGIIQNNTKCSPVPLNNSTSKTQQTLLGHFKVGSDVTLGGNLTVGATGVSVLPGALTNPRGSLNILSGSTLTLSKDDVRKDLNVSTMTDELECNVLCGAGTVVVGTLTNEGTVASSFGSQDIPLGSTLTIDGNYTQTEKGSLSAWLSPTDIDKFNITGNVDMQGSMKFYTGTKDSDVETVSAYLNFEGIQFLSADGTVSGAFTQSVDQTPADGDTRLLFTISPVAAQEATKAGFKIDLKSLNLNIDSNPPLSNLNNHEKMYYTVTGDREFGASTIQLDAQTTFLSKLTVPTGSVLTFTNPDNVDVTLDSLTLQQGASLAVGSNFALKVKSFEAGEQSHIYLVVRPDGTANSIQSTTTQLGHDMTFHLRYAEGTYPSEVYNYTILTSNEIIQQPINPEPNSVGQFNINTAGMDGATFSGGYSEDGKTIYIKADFTKANNLTLQQDQVLPDGVNPVVDSLSAVVESNQVLAPVGGEYIDGQLLSSALDSSGLINIVFSKTDSSLQDSQADAFRAKFSPVRSIYAKRPTQQLQLEDVFNAVNDEGPKSAKKGNWRVWTSPYVTRFIESAASQTDLGSKKWAGGIYAGAEYRGAGNSSTTGLLLGYAYSKAVSSTDSRISTKTSAFTLGAYNTYKYFDHMDTYGTFTHELLVAVNHGKNAMKRQAKYSLKLNNEFAYQATSPDNTSRGLLANGQLNYITKLGSDKVTMRLDVGFTQTYSKDTAFSELVNDKLQQTESAFAKSSEIYFGPGFRYIWSNKQRLIRLTGVYEYGVELQNKTTGGAVTRQILDTRQTVDSTLTLLNGASSGKTTNKHYIQLNGSYLDKEIGWKFIFTYSGTLYPRVQNHTYMLKFERRF